MQHPFFEPTTLIMLLIYMFCVIQQMRPLALPQTRMHRRSAKHDERDHRHGYQFYICGIAGGYQETTAGFREGRAEAGLIWAQWVEQGCGLISEVLVQPD
jgi:hypothetical protein